MLSKIESSHRFIRNLGLSLTDYFWVKPIDSNLKWEDVNLFQNPFQNEWQVEKFSENEGDNIDIYNPNSSLQGQLEKNGLYVMTSDIL